MICPHCGKTVKEPDWIRRNRKKATPKKLPTEVQLRLLKLIHKFNGAMGYAPTYQWLADQLTRSKVTVFEHVSNLRSLYLVGDGQIVLTEAGRAHAERVLDK